MQTAKIEHDQVRNIAINIEDRNRRIERSTNEKTLYEKSFKDNKKVVNLYKRKAVVELYKGEGLPKELLTELLSNRDSRLRGASSSMRDSSVQIDYLERNIGRYERDKETYEGQKIKLEEKYPSKLIHINDIKMQLAGFTNVDWKRTNISQSPSNKPVLNIYFHDVKCTTSRNNYKNIWDKSWIQGDIKAMFWLSSNNVKFIGLNGDKYPKGYTTNRCHPHVLGDNKPCLGDFLGGLVEARENYDFETIASILQMFLEQANDRDEAGSYWVRWALAAADKGKHIAWINACGYHETRSGIPYYGYATTVRGDAAIRVPILKKGVLEWHAAPYNSVDFEVWAKKHFRR